jgi:hypothetical protein
MASAEYLTKTISQAVFLMRESPSLDDTGVYEALVADGVEQGVALRLTVFLPMAYCRLFLSGTGVKFADGFQYLLPEGGISPETPFSAEPLWQACVTFADAEIKSSVGAKDFLRIAGRSAEFNAVNQQLHAGSKLEDLVLTPVLLTWPEFSQSFSQT